MWGDSEPQIGIPGIQKFLANQRSRGHSKVGRAQLILKKGRVKSLALQKNGVGHNRSFFYTFAIVLFEMRGYEVGYDRTHFGYGPGYDHIDFADLVGHDHVGGGP